MIIIFFLPHTFMCIFIERILFVIGASHDFKFEQGHGLYFEWEICGHMAVIKAHTKEFFCI